MKEHALSCLEMEILSYIESNKGMVLELLKQKFFESSSTKSFQAVIKKLEIQKYLKKCQQYPKAPVFVFLTLKARTQLQKQGGAYLPASLRQPKINIFERQHDFCVQQIRMSIENSKNAWKDFVWLSDYEMRCGMNLSWKKNKTLLRPFQKYTRIPNGIFEIRLNGHLVHFVLEYEHAAYSHRQIQRMVMGLQRTFPDFLFLIVARNKIRTLRLARIIDPWISHQSSERDRWIFSFYEKAIQLPFEKIPWVNLNTEYAFFVEDSIKNFESLNPK